MREPLSSCWSWRAPSHWKKEGLSQRSLYSFSLISSFPASDFWDGKKLPVFNEYQKFEKDSLNEFLNLRKEQWVLCYKQPSLCSYTHTCAHTCHHAYTGMHTHTCIWTHAYAHSPSTLGNPGTHPFKHPWPPAFPTVVRLGPYLPRKLHPVPWNSHTFPYLPQENIFVLYTPP